MNAMFVAAMAAAILVGGGSTAAALPKSHAPLTTFSRSTQPKPPKPVLHVPLGIYETWGTDTVAVGGGVLTAIDTPVTFKCSKDNGCTVIGHLAAQYYSATNAAHWSLCMVVDGTYANHACYYQGVQNAADEYVMGNDRQNFPVAMGTHTVQTYVYPEFDGYIGSYQMDYEITTP